MMNQSQKQAIHAYTVADDRDNFSIAFIHKELDDFGLDPFSFRVYMRIIRRAGGRGVWESNKNMADGCCMSESQVKRSLNTLVRHGLIIKELRPGKTCLYRVAPRSNWSKSILLQPPDTDSSDRTNRNGDVLNDSENIVRIVPTELLPRSGRANHLGLVELQSISNRSKSNKDLERSVVENSEKPKNLVHFKNPKLQVIEDSRFVDNKNQDFGINSKSNHEAKSSAHFENNYQNLQQNWQCPEPQLRREFMKWLSETMCHIQTARHASNWCNKYPQEADLAWDDFISAQSEVENQKSAIADYLPQQHELLRQKYKSALQYSCDGLSAFLEQFEQQHGAWLDWVRENHPEWLSESP